MIIIDICRIFLLIVLSIISSYTDIKTGLIKNKMVLGFSVLGVLINIIGILLTEYLPIYSLIKMILISLISLLMYIIHVWAAGDSKLLFCISLLIPYSDTSNIFDTLFVVYGNIFVIGFIFLIFDSIDQTIKERRKIDIFKIYQQTLKNWFINISYILIVDILINVLIRNYEYKHYVTIMFNFILLYFIYKNNKIKKTALAMINVFLVIVLDNLFKLDFINKFMIWHYVLIVVIIFVKSFISQYNYQIIKTKDVKKGMVLSTETTLMFVNSKVKGLPKISQELIVDKITQDEADSVRRWGKSSKGKENIQIVRKMPFAIFISAGTLLYSVLEVLNK